MFTIVRDDTVIKISKDDLFVTSDATIWAALRSRNMFPLKVALTDTAIQVSYLSKDVMEFIPNISSGVANLDEISAHGATVIWKAIFGFMKMLS